MDVILSFESREDPKMKFIRPSSIHCISSISRNQRLIVNEQQILFFFSSLREFKEFDFFNWF